VYSVAFGIVGLHAIFEGCRAFPTRTPSMTLAGDLQDDKPAHAHERGEFNHCSLLLHRLARYCPGAVLGCQKCMEIGEGIATYLAKHASANG
jgi:hypothetical protein